MTTDPACTVCGAYATYVSPDDLCHEHWEAWWTEGYTADELTEYYQDRVEFHQEQIAYYRRKMTGEHPVQQSI